MNVVCPAGPDEDLRARVFLDEDGRVYLVVPETLRARCLRLAQDRGRSLVRTLLQVALRAIPAPWVPALPTRPREAQQASDPVTLARTLVAAANAPSVAVAA